MCVVRQKMIPKGQINGHSVKPLPSQLWEARNDNRRLIVVMWSALCHQVRGVGATRDFEIIDLKDIFPIEPAASQFRSIEVTVCTHLFSSSHNPDVGFFVSDAFSPSVSHLYPIFSPSVDTGSLANWRCDRWVLFGLMRVTWLYDLDPRTSISFIEASVCDAAIAVGGEYLATSRFLSGSRHPREMVSRMHDDRYQGRSRLWG